jgi:hypothetical protein
MSTQQQKTVDLRPFWLNIPVPPMLAEVMGYTGSSFGQPLDARYVGFYWERAGDETCYMDGRYSGTGEFTGFLAFVEHPRVAVHLLHCDFGSSEEAPRHVLVLDRTEQKLYALPVKFAQQFLGLQWTESIEQESGQQAPAYESLEQILNLETWKEVPLPGNIDSLVAANMQQQAQLVNQMVEWLNEQHVVLTPDRKAEYEPRSTAMLLRHVFAGENGFAQAGELVHLHEIIEAVTDQVVVSFYRDNGVDGPDTTHLFVVTGSWQEIAETIEILIDLNTLDDLLDGEDSLDQVLGRYADWHGQPFPIVSMLESLAIRASIACARCHGNPMTLFMRSGLHNGAFCYAYDAQGTYQANLRDQEYVCARCERAQSGNQDAE